MKTECVYMLVVLMLAVFAGTSAAGKPTVTTSSSFASNGKNITLTCKVDGGHKTAYRYKWYNGVPSVTGDTKTLEVTGTNEKKNISCEEKTTHTGNSSATPIWFTDMILTMKGKTEAKVNETVEVTCSVVGGKGTKTYTWAVDTLGVGSQNQIEKNKYNVSSNKAINVNVMCIANDTKGAEVGKLHTIKFKGAPASELGEKPSATEKENSSVTFKLGLGISLPLVMAAVSALKLW